MKKLLSLIMALIMLFTMMPLQAFAVETAEDRWAGKKVSILSHSISTYDGVSNNANINSTIGNNDIYYTEGRYGVYQKDTWWQQVIDALGMELLVNNSWSGSCVYMPRKGEASIGYGDRAVNLHNDYTGEEPDIIFVYLGCNDFAYYKDTFGQADDVDYVSLIQDNGDGTFTYSEPQTTCEAYAIMLHKVQNRYPDAEIYCMTSTARRETDYAEDTYPDAGQPTEYSAELQQVATKYGFPVVDLENAIPKEVELFDEYMGDKRAHPNALGMDQITNEVLSVMLGKDAGICHVTSEDGTVQEQAVLVGGSYSADVELRAGYSITVIMGGKDITADAYSNGKIFVKEVTGDIVISSEIRREPLNFRWEIKDNALVSVGDADNILDVLTGTIANGTLTDIRCELEKTIVLKHNLPWEIEWQCAGDWRGVMFASTSVQRTVGINYLCRTKGGQLCFGTWTGTQHDNYGVDLSTLDDQAHTYRLENRIAADGSNMVWLYLDGVEIGPMNNYFIASQDQKTTSDWVSGRDFVLPYIGTESTAVSNCQLKYIQVWEAGQHTHSHTSITTAPTCTEQGYTTFTCTCGDSYVDNYVDATDHNYKNGSCTDCGVTAPALAGKTISILGASISTYSETSNGTAAQTTNSTIENNVHYYPNETVNDVTLNDTWWMQVCSDLGLRLLVNNSWSGSSLLHTRNGTVGAYVDRCVQLHDDTGTNAGEMPDIIGIQMGTNDFQYYKDTLGTADINYAALITKNEDGSYSYAAPETSLEAAAIVLHKISVRYPDAEVYYLNISQRVDDTDELIQSFNAELKQVVEHFGANIVDIYGSAITMDNFGTYIGDGRVHPNKLGMDAYAEAFKQALVENTGYSTDTHIVSLKLDGVAADYGDDKIVANGKDYTVKLTATAGMDLDVNVTMGKQDVTDTVYSNGTVTIDSVTADVTITAKSVHTPKDYRWEFNGTDLVSVLGDNVLTKNAGTTTNGVFSKTRYALKNSVVLLHDSPWVVEWKSEGTFKNTNGSSGARVFTTTDVNSEYNARYIFKSANQWLVAMGEKDTKGSHNYGIALADHGIDGSAPHTYRLENHIADDGSNMIYLFVDGEKIGPMNNYYIGTTSQNTTSDWLSGKDFVFPYMGTDTHGFTNASIEYIRISERAHTYTNGVCTDCGAQHPAMADYKGKVISILGGSTCTFDGYIPVADGFNLAHRPRYPQNNLLTDVNDTWWMQIINTLDAKLGINDSWAGSQVLNTLDNNSGDLGPDAAMASLTRIKNLGANGTPDVILFYGAMNDIGRAVALGAFNAETAPTQVDLIATKWNNLADAYVAAIMRMQHYYPDARIVAMLPGPTASYYTESERKAYCEVLKDICEHYGVLTVDLSSCGLTTADMPDGTHPNAKGMDYITAAVMETLLEEIKVERGENVVHSVVHELSGAKSSLSYYKGVSHGNTFTTTITGEDVTVNVNMGGVDITEQAYADGKIMISSVTDDVTITAKGAYNADGRLQKLPETYCKNTNLWTVLEPVNEYYTANGWGNNSNSNYSVTFPVTAGDHIWATSFGAAGTNGYTANAVRITWFSDDGVLKSVDRATVYKEFADNGYVTAPEGAVAVNIPMVSNADTWEIYILNRDHSYENGVCQGCGHITGPVITQQPVNAEVKLGEDFCVTVKARGEDLKYQWYYRNAGSDKWYKSGVKDNTYDDVMTKARANREIYCVITDANGKTVTSDTAKLVCVPFEELEIINQPVDDEVLLGEEFCVTVNAKGDELEYQWYYRNAGSDKWYKSGVKDNTYDDVMTKARANREIYCVITDAYGNSVTTDIAKLIRGKINLEIVSQPADSTVSFGERFCATVEAEGEGLKYQWYYRNYGTDKWYKSSVKDNTYDDVMTEARNGREIYCVITDTYGDTVTTETVKLTAAPKVELAILSQTYQGAAMGERFCATVEAEGEGLKYQWYFRNAGTDKWYKSSVKDNTYDDVMTKARANREIYCVITDRYGNKVTTDTVTLQVI